MNRDLITLRDHCRTMALAERSTEAECVLWVQIADEIDTFLTRSQISEQDTLI